MSTYLVSGASGFVGHAVAARLVEQGESVRAMTRHPQDYDGPGEAVFGDVEDADSLTEALQGVDVAYYLVHSLDADDFEEAEQRNARAFGSAAADAGVSQIIFLSGLGPDEVDGLSVHLRSRRRVEDSLRQGVPVTVLRAAMIVGPGGISWDITRQLAQRLPAMVLPKWAHTDTQPIGLDDTVSYLVAAAGDERLHDRAFEIGGPEAMTYAEMLAATAEVVRGRAPFTVPAPVLSKGLSAHWIRLITDVDATTATHLIDSMDVPMVVRDDELRRLTGIEPADYQSVAKAAADAE